MEHLLLWLIHYLLKAFNQKKSTPPVPPISARISTDVWADYSHKQAAIEREMTAKSPTAQKN